MATMVKEKKREKKKAKEKHFPQTQEKTELSSTLHAPLNEEVSPVNIFKHKKSTLDDNAEITSQTSAHGYVSMHEESICKHKSDHVLETDTISTPEPSLKELDISSVVYDTRIFSDPKIISKDTSQLEVPSENLEDNPYSNLNSKLENMCILRSLVSLSEDRATALEAEDAYIKSNSIVEEACTSLDITEDKPVEESFTEVAVPTAPMLEAEEPQVKYREERVVQEVPKLVSMSLDEAIGMFGGAEMAEVFAMSAKEEAIVEAGPISGPEHPLVDLLSTFKHSLKSVEREKDRLTVGFDEEEKLRTALWRISKQTICVSEDCRCGGKVTFKARYETAELLKDKLPIARMRLEGLLRDVQDSYCHHLHEAILAHCQIEEFVAETIQSNKNEIREALSLILQALKLSDSAPPALAGALQRWATALSSALLEGSDLRQLLFLIHHLFRQTRSVRWAGGVVDLRVYDRVGAARVLAVLDLLLTRAKVDSSVECMEDKEEQWEEVDKDGGGGAVSDDMLRERDLLALLQALPLRDLVARIMLFTDGDVSSARPWCWGETHGGRDVVTACCGVRALLDVLHRGLRTPAPYPRLRRELQLLAATTLKALAALHLHARSYTKEMELKVQAELEAAFAAGLSLLEPTEMHRLPTTLLSVHSAADYCNALTLNLHESSSVPSLTCGIRVKLVAQAAIQRTDDPALAATVLQFLFKVGVQKSITPCKGTCREEARDALPRLLTAHTHLYPVALLLVADTSQVEKLESSVVSVLLVGGWRPSASDARAVCGDWARRCPALLPALLMAVDCTPYTGLSLDSQEAIGQWLCEHVSGGEGEDWCWAVLRRLRVHRTCWGLPPEAPSPHQDPTTLFEKAYALMATSWGHCIPLICSVGVDALCALASSRPADAVHCLAPIMLLLAHSHDSIALTPRFGECVGILSGTGASLVSRALGRRPGAPLLLRLVREHLASPTCDGVSSNALARAWASALWVWAPVLLDSALTPTRGHHALYAHADGLAAANDEESIKQACAPMSLGAQAPLVCHSSLQAWLARREGPGLLPALLDTLHAQRTAGHRIHVDNALKSLGARMSADELVIHRTAAAVLVAPTYHPAHLLLWALLMHLYLQRPPSNMRDTTPPVGPLFFSGIIKSNTLSQLKRRLQDTIKYHVTEANSLTSPRTPRPSTSKVSESEISSGKNIMISTLSIADLTGQPMSEGYGDVEAMEDSKRDSRERSPSDSVKDNANLIAYHLGAERMLAAYLQWLEEGPRTSVGVHHADLARFIPEPAMEAAWHREGDRSPVAEGSPLPLPPSVPPSTPPPPDTPFELALKNILKIKTRVSPSLRRLIQSPVGDVDFRDPHTMLALVDQHLKDIVILSKEWCAEVGRISCLDNALWQLVPQLRVPRPLPPILATCPSKCKPMSYISEKIEWCISVGAEKGVKENRAAAFSAVRELARPRPAAAKTAAALLTIARRVRSGSAAKAAITRAWRAAAGVSAACAPAAAALTAFCRLLAERWLHSEAETCAELIRSWYSGPGSPLQAALVGPLVAPARASPDKLPNIHSALLSSSAPRRSLFSHLSKFDMSRWAGSVDSAARREMLFTLIEAATRFDRSRQDTNGDTDTDTDMLVELLSVQAASVCTRQELRAFACALASNAMDAPSPVHAHLSKAARTCAPYLTYDELGHLLRELGGYWWAVRRAGRARRWAGVVPHAASLLHALHPALVGAAVQLSYAPERVAVVAWASLLEAWSAWVSPQGGIVGDVSTYNVCLDAFRKAIDQLMIDCPGTEEVLLSQIFEWMAGTQLSVRGEALARAGMSALRVAMATVPWHRHQWLTPASLHAMAQVYQDGDQETRQWCANCTSMQSASAWLRDSESDLPSRLALLLYIYTQPPLPLSLQTMEEAVTLPWCRLPELALEEALDRFFMVQHGLNVPFHQLPQFRIILAASELVPTSGTGGSSREKRSRLVSQWVRAAGTPALLGHVSHHVTALLDTIAAAAPYLVNSDGEVEELLSRAMVILCIEPAATSALPVWVSFARNCDRHSRGAVVRAVCALTAFEYFAKLADAVAAACLADPDNGGWLFIKSAWAQCPWGDASSLAARGRLHAAYGLALAQTQELANVRQALLALLARDIHFIDNELIISVWICYACRVGASASEVGGAALALLRRWAAPPGRRTLLQTVTMQPAHHKPTAKHRLLCLLGLSVLETEPADVANATRAYEAECRTQLGAAAGAGPIGSKGAGPVGTEPMGPKGAGRLPKLAAMLYPQATHYFEAEAQFKAQ